MGETSDQIERHIQKTRNDLGDNFSELEEKVKTVVDWRAQFEERPMTMVALAFGGGILLSALLPPLRAPRRRDCQDRWNAPPDLEATIPSIESRSVGGGKAKQALETWDALKGALVGVAASKLSGFVEDLLPGFKQEFTKAQSGKSSDRSDLSTSGQATRQRANAAGAD
jgi:hypothetical protein